MNNCFVEQNNIINICSNSYHPIINLENVVGMGLGYKYINGQNAGIHCIQIFVEKKLNKCYVKPNNIIPAYYKGFPTDVVEMNNMDLLSLESKIRPVQGGYSVSPIARRDLTGTLGCVVYNTDHLGRKKDFFILSNNHVIAGGNKVRKGTQIIQPGARDAGGASDVIGTLYDFVEVKEKGLFSSPENLVDAAIAKLTDISLASTKIAMVGDIKGVTNASLGMKVKKIGKMTGVTDGEVTSIGVTISIKFNTKKAIFKDQIMCNLINYGGDSGSVVLEKSTNKVIGLLFSGNSTTCVVNNIKNVLDAFKVKIYSK